VCQKRGATLKLAKVRKPKLRDPPEFMREEEKLKQLEANQKKWEKYLKNCLVAETVQVCPSHMRSFSRPLLLSSERRDVGVTGPHSWLHGI